MAIKTTTKENEDVNLPECCANFSPLFKKILAVILIILGISILLPVIFPLAWSLVRIIFSLAVIYLGLVLILGLTKKVK